MKRPGVSPGLFFGVKALETGQATEELQYFPTLFLLD
jgi:hypothetical protein